MPNDLELLLEMRTDSLPTDVKLAWAILFKLVDEGKVQDTTSVKHLLNALCSIYTGIVKWRFREGAVVYEN